MKSVNSKILKLVGVLCFSVFIGYQTLSNSFDKKAAISELKEMKLIEITLQKSKGTSSTRDKNLLEDAEICLSKMDKIPNYRFGEDVEWRIVRFIGKNKIHNISYAELSSGKIALGVEYILTNTESGESLNVGGGRGMSSNCLGDIFDNI